MRPQVELEAAAGRGLIGYAAILPDGRRRSGVWAGSQEMRSAAPAIQGGGHVDQINGVPLTTFCRDEANLAKRRESQRPT